MSAIITALGGGDTQKKKVLLPTFIYFRGNAGEETRTEKEGQNHLVPTKESFGRDGLGVKRQAVQERRS